MAAGSPDLTPSVLFLWGFFNKLIEDSSVAEYPGTEGRDTDIVNTISIEVFNGAAKKGELTRIWKREIHTLNNFTTATERTCNQLHETNISELSYITN